jgi:hypothetical protein
VEEVAATSAVELDTVGRLSCCVQAMIAAQKNPIATRIHQDESRAERATAVCYVLRR